MMIILLSCNVYGACPQDDASLVLFSSLSGWNTLNSALTITQRVKVDQSPTNKLKSITIKNGGALIFDDKNLNLDLDYILVESGGEFIMGSDSCPIQNKIIITFYGDRTTDNIIGTDLFDNQVAGAKGIAFFTGSKYQMFGAVNGPSWTLLSQTASKGSQTIQLKNNVSWKVGDSIVIASTDYGEILDYRGTIPKALEWKRGIAFPDQNEERKVSAIQNGGLTIVLDRPLNYTHFVKDYTTAEVGLLTRNIVLRGDPSSDQSEFGGHVFIRLVEKGQMQGVEFTKLGQRGVMGRYSVHFHIMGEKAFKVSDQIFLKDCSIHHAFQRCVTLHDSNGILVENNVCFDTFGHQYFLEDGTEMGNKLINNIGIRPRPVADDKQIIPSDSDVSVFWITNPNNTFIGNRAVGGRFGFWFTMPKDATGASAGKYGTENFYVRPRWQPLGAFKFNVAHSTTGNGFEIDNMEKSDGTTELAGYNPLIGPYPKGVETWELKSIDAIFEGLIAFKNRGYGVWARGGPLVFKNLTLFDNMNQMNSPPGPSIIMDSVMIGETENTGDSSFRPTVDVGGRSRPRLWSTNTEIIKGYETYDNGGPQILRNVLFKNLMTNEYRYAGALGSLSNAPFKHQTRNRYAEIKFENANRYYVSTELYDGNKGTNILDIDGSVTDLKPSGWIVTNESITLFNGCVPKPEWNAYKCPVFAEGYGQLRVTNVDVTATNIVGADGKSYPDLANPSKKVVRMNFVDMLRGHSIPALGATSGGTPRLTLLANVIMRGFYTIRPAYDTPTPAKIEVSLESNADRDWIIFSAQYPRGTQFTITSAVWSGQVTALSAASSLQEVVADRSKYFYDSESEHLFIKLENKAGKSGFSERWGFTDYNYDGFVITINAACPGNRCAPSAYRLPENVKYYHLKYIKEERYIANLQTCQQSTITTVANDAAGQGIAYAFFSPSSRTLDVAVHHDLTKIVTKIEVGIGEAGAERRLIPLHKISPYSLSRFSFDISYDEWVSLVKGEMFIKISTTQYPNGHLRGQLHCNNGKSSTGTPSCSLPPPLPKASACDSIDNNLMFNIYREAEDIKGWPYWDLWVWNGPNTDTANTSVNANYNVAPICGKSSFKFGLQSGGIQIAKHNAPTQTPNPIIDSSVFKYFEFFVKSLSGPLSLTLTFKDLSSDLAAIKITSEYIQHYKIDDTKVTRVRIPVSDLKFKSVKQNVQYIVITLTDRTSYKEFLIDNMRFVTNNATDSSTTSIVTNNDIKGVTSICGTQVTDPDPFTYIINDVSALPSFVMASDKPQDSSKPQPGKSNTASTIIGSGATALLLFIIYLLNTIAVY
ncbi:hypothetical protein ABK040_007917 [Willaertia magna]